MSALFLSASTGPSAAGEVAVIGGIVCVLFLAVGIVDLFWGWFEKHDVPARIDQATRDSIKRMIDAEADGDALLAGWDEVAS